ncbi:MAG TPA: hypothetical protein VEX65_03445 [Flavisolibacter sp.]|jgi:hypothetical protein|nr:hypothetical protein [Flavisolibacter sp.]
MKLITQPPRNAFSIQDLNNDAGLVGYYSNTYLSAGYIKDGDVHTTAGFRESLSRHFHLTNGELNQ